MFSKANYHFLTVFFPLFLLKAHLFIFVSLNPGILVASTNHLGESNSSVLFIFPGCATEPGPASTFAACDESVKAGHYASQCESTTEVAKCAMSVVCGNCLAEEIGSFTETVKSVLKPICNEGVEVDESALGCSTGSWFKRHWLMILVVTGLVVMVIIIAAMFAYYLFDSCCKSGGGGQEDKESGGGGANSKKQQTAKHAEKSAKIKSTKSAKPSAKSKALKSVKQSAKAKSSKK